MLFYQAFFLFFWSTDTAELVMLTVIPTKDAKTEMETRQVTAEALISKCLT